MSLLDRGESISDEALARALDALAAVYHDTPSGRPSDAEAEPPRDDYRLIRQHVGRIFPDLGLYATADPLEVPNEEALVGDAIDDISDIALDLKEILWRWQNLGADDAIWHFRFGYQTHWGRHLHGLRFYLHAKQF
ncbi:DUF5063 domain-containing protein [Microvirga makkahensis]|uniref:DUF5063 domain-containing protein n=1 Tax=Microvirga makkahensis TaxID=1128670 RepID=A0A7X3MQS2_9HYPH|nr:DUF5063 domain-containing protein [Microvirga makkahensis]